MTLVEEQVLAAIISMMQQGSTGSLTLHFNRGMVQKIERTEYQALTAKRTVS